MPDFPNGFPRYPAGCPFLAFEVHRIDGEVYRRVLMPVWAERPEEVIAWGLAMGGAVEVVNL